MRFIRPTENKLAERCSAYIATVHVDLRCITLEHVLVFSFSGVPGDEGPKLPLLPVGEARLHVSCDAVDKQVNVSPPLRHAVDAPGEQTALDENRENECTHCRSESPS
jgi:hypothetical protein